MNCHIVPKVYLKQWKIPSSSSGIYVFDKNNIGKTGIQKNIGNLKDTSFASKNYYVLDEANPNHDFALRNIPKLSDKEKFIIEKDYFDCKVENSWELFVDYVNSTLINKKAIKTIEKNKAEFLEFFAIQFFRREENFSLLIMESILDEIDKMITDGELSSEDRARATSSLFFNALLKQARGEPNYINTMITAFANEFQIIFLIAHFGASFITSDNPCFYHNVPNEICNGTYMPINKKVCAYLIKLKVEPKAKYLIVDISKNNTKYVNKLISDYAIASLAYDSSNIDNLFESNFNGDEWTASMEKVSLKH